MFTDMESIMEAKTCRDTFYEPTGCEYYTCNRRCTVKHGFDALGYCFSFFVCHCEYTCYGEEMDVENHGVSPSPS